MFFSTNINRINRIACLLLAIAIVHHVNGQLRMRLPSDDEDIRTEYVDRNNMTILAMFNLTTAEMNRKLSNTQTNSQSDVVNEPHNGEVIDQIIGYRLNDIRNRLESVFQVGKSEESQEQEQSKHEMAAYPICGTETNESSWLEDNNVTIRFSDSLFETKSDHLNLDSAILRLYKLDPNAKNQSGSEATSNTPNTKHCGEPMLDSQVRVTVSIVQQIRRNKRERKKRICNTIMMNVSKTGWVEIDIKRAIYIWESVEQQQSSRAQPHQGRNLVGWLMIEVHDEEERPLKPGLFFSPPKCDQADLAIPWNYYRPHAALSTSTADQVPKCPRLDVTLTGYATWAATKSHSNHLENNLPRSIHLRQQLSRNENINFNPINAATATHRPHKHKRHSQRSPQPIAHYVDSSKRNSNHA